MAPVGTPSARGLVHSTVAEVHGVVNFIELLTSPSPVKEEGTCTISYAILYVLLLYSYIYVCTVHGQYTIK